MTALVEHDVCVCVQDHSEECTDSQTVKSKSQDGSVCMISHTPLFRVLVVVLYCLGDQITSSMSRSRQSFTSAALVVCEVIDNG